MTHANQAIPGLMSINDLPEAKAAAEALTARLAAMRAARAARPQPTQASAPAVVKTAVAAQSTDDYWPGFND